MHVAINPGAGPVADASCANAAIAAGLFVHDLRIEGVVLRTVGADLCRGRLLFELKNEANGLTCHVDMPGCDPALTRAGTPWESPRLYVDGSSWLWPFGLNIAYRKLTGEQE